MKRKEDCRWCMSTQHIVRNTNSHNSVWNLPDEFKHRCSACHEAWIEEFGSIIAGLEDDGYFILE